MLCAGLSPPGWLLNETESRAYTTQIEAHSWYLHDQSFTSTHHTVYWSIESEWVRERQARLIIICSYQIHAKICSCVILGWWFTLNIWFRWKLESELWLEPTGTGEIPASCFYFYFSVFFFLFLLVFFIPVAWQSTSVSYQGYMRPKQWNKGKKSLYYFDNVDFVLKLSDMCRCMELIGRNPKY